MIVSLMLIMTSIKIFFIVQEELMTVVASTLLMATAKKILYWVTLTNDNLFSI